MLPVLLPLQPFPLLVLLLDVLLSLFFAFLHVPELPLHVIVVIVVAVVRRERQRVLCLWHLDIFEIRAHEQLQLLELLRTHLVQAIGQAVLDTRR